MAHLVCTTCTCGHVDHLHRTEKPHVCRVKGCECFGFTALDPADDPAPEGT